MDRDELELRKKIDFLLEDYGLDYILDLNDTDLPELLVFLVYNWGLKIPDEQYDDEDQTFDPEG